MKDPIQTTTHSFEDQLIPERSPMAELWHLLKMNRLAFTGLFIFIFFFCVAFTGLILTSGSNPAFDPAMVRLQEKLRPPLSAPQYDLLSPEQLPPMGVYLLGTDDLGRDIFARMLQGAWVSLTVGFVAVGISVIIGILFGGIAGYCGHYHLRVDHLLSIAALLAGITILAMKAPVIGIALILMGSFYFFYSLRIVVATAIKSSRPWIHFLLSDTISLDTLIMRFVDIMLCFPSFFLILTVVALLPASIYNIMIIIGLTSWMGTTRFVRAEILSLREQDFVTAARALGLSS